MPGNREAAIEAKPPQNSAVNCTETLCERRGTMGRRAPIDRKESMRWTALMQR
jgi:hypothetical protein